MGLIAWYSADLHRALCVEIKAVGSIQSVFNEPKIANYQMSFNAKRPKKISLPPDSISNFQDE